MIIPSLPRRQKRLASATHVALYLLLVVMPILAWLTLSAAGKPIPFFGVQLLALLAENKSLSDQLKEVHETIRHSRLLPDWRACCCVAVDTAPTGHTMLLMDATGAYHRQMTREFEGHGDARVVTPLMRLQHAAYTKIILVTLLEVTPVSQAAAMQEDLRRRLHRALCLGARQDRAGCGHARPAAGSAILG